jgi:dihydroorotate dehydrogenase
LEGGIHSADDAIEKLEAGACLVQLTQVFYEGPALVKAINKKILAKIHVMPYLKRRTKNAQRHRQLSLSR